MPALRALGLFERALAIDANDAECAGGTRLDLSAAVVDDDSPAAAGRRGGAAGNRSRAPGAGDRRRQGEAYAVLGRLKMTYDWDWKAAEADLMRAVALAPESVEAQVGHGLFLSAVGRHDEALAALSGRARSTRRGARRTSGWALPGGWRATASARWPRWPMRSPSTPKRGVRISGAWSCSTSSGGTRKRRASARYG